MMLQIAWRNVLRNRKRSAIIMAAIMFGLWGGLVASGVSFGFSYDTVASAIETRLSHIQIHNPRYRESQTIRDTLRDAHAALMLARDTRGVVGVTGRLVVEGMAASAETATGVSILGVDAAAETTVTTLHQHLVEGIFAFGGRRNQIVVGADLAKRLGVRLGSKIVLTTQDVHGTIVGASYRISGMFRTDSKTFDETTVLVDRGGLAEMVGLGQALHEVAVLVEDASSIDSVAARLRAELPGTSVETWREIAPELNFIYAYTDVYLEIFLGIIVLALLFGITNTMLMSVLDRIREFGVLSAIGMGGRRVFAMILMESLALSIAGAILGMVAGWGTVAYLQSVGINLSAFADGMRQWGYSEVSHPVLPGWMYVEVLLAMMVAALLGAMYPAWRAVRLDPARAIQTY
jgi:putative ABC transport system permease protein